MQSDANLLEKLQVCIILWKNSIWTLSWIVVELENTNNEHCFCGIIIINYSCCCIVVAVIIKLFMQGELFVQFFILDNIHTGRLNCFIITHRSGFKYFFRLTLYRCMLSWKIVIVHNAIVSIIPNVTGIENLRPKAIRNNFTSVAYTWYKTDCSILKKIQHLYYRFTNISKQFILCLIHIHSPFFLFTRRHTFAIYNEYKWKSYQIISCLLIIQRKYDVKRAISRQTTITAKSNGTVR